MRVIRLLPLAALFVLHAFAADKKTGQPNQIQFKQFKLDNGLRVVLAEDHAAPTYSIAVTYNVGSRDERPGRTGFAHLFEHMMFQGSENVGKGEHFLLVFNNGGSMNGTTSPDRTNYFQTLPANQLELGLFLEADRMRSLVINQANLDNQRKAVQEERRLGIDNQPYGKTFEIMDEIVYDNFGYKHSTIGSMADLNAATLEDVASFFKTYYAPNNAVLALVGDFNTEDVLERIKKHFGGISQQPAPPAPDMAEPEQKAERRHQLEDGFAQAPRLDIIYKLPHGNTPDVYAANVLARVLGAGQSSRLYQKLVKEKEVVVQIAAGVDERRGPSQIYVDAVVRPGKDLAETEKLILDEIERIKAEPVQDWELQKVRMASKRQGAAQLEGSLYRAMLLSQYTVYYDDPGLVNRRPSLLQAVTKDDIQRIAKTYLTPANRTVVITTVKAKAAPAVKGGN
ncbi:MAG: insulinase family protein [Acidobacteria bacterium]|nr:insulinase family protein [Acidobacteriota bacterium]